ncbi:MAG: hypothetical protein DHS20C05_02840 [Hyphococcus sp.]|nr:MAG: hypothetical protein DHS20C05_02840 [Marinicaulis sp.]
MLGGPYVYDGFGLYESHAPLDINTAEFNATVELLQDAINEADVSFRTQNKRFENAGADEA